MVKTCYSCTGVIEPDQDMFICVKCSENRIYKTDVIKSYKLDDSDLKKLPCGHTTYRHNLCTYYYKPHVIELTVEKYGLDWENVFRQKESDIKKLQQSKTTIRLDKIKSAFESNGLDWTRYANKPEVKEYLSNGKNIKQIIGKYKLVDQKEKILNVKLAENNLQPDGLYCNAFVYGYEENDIDDDFIEGLELDYEINNYYSNKTKKIISSIDNLIEHLKLMRRNKLILETKLMINGLELRPDSQICNDFIDGSNDYSLNKIVSIMKEMDWLYSHTNYAQILKDTRQKHISTQRAYGWYEHDDYEEEKVRKQAKSIAMGKIKAKPNFDIVV